MRPRIMERWNVTDIEVWGYSLLLIRLFHSLGFDMIFPVYFLATYFLSCVPRSVLGIIRLLLTEEKSQAVFSILFMGFTIGLILDFPGLSSTTKLIGLVWNSISISSSIIEAFIRIVKGIYNLVAVAWFISLGPLFLYGLWLLAIEKLGKLKKKNNKRKRK